MLAPSLRVELVNKVPDTDMPRFDSDNDVPTAQGLRIGYRLLLPDVAGRDTACGLGHLGVDEARVASKLDSTKWSFGLGHHDGDSRIAPQMLNLHVLRLDPHIEATVAPFVSDRGQQDTPVGPQSGQDSQ